MTPIDLTNKPSWLTPEFERPQNRAVDESELWSENYLMYAWSPDNELGVFIHLSHRVQGLDLWDEVLIVALPGDRYLVSHSATAGQHISDVLSVAGISYRVDEAFSRITKTFRGGARHVTGEEYRRGPITDGLLTPIRLEIVYEAMTLPFDLGGAHIDTDWGHGHYEQHMFASGSLIFDGETHKIMGTGLRDHTWGRRDSRILGSGTAWLNAQFPKSGRGFLAMAISGNPPRPPYKYAVLANRTSITPTESSGVPMPTSVAECESDYEFELVLPDGTPTTVSAEILNAPRTGVVGPAKLAVGTFAAPVAIRHCVDAFTRFEWDGEVGYGITERTFDLAR